MADPAPAVTVSPRADPGYGDLVGVPVRDVDATVVAVKPDDGGIEPVPHRSRTLDAGDLLYVVASPATIRALEARAGGDGT